MMKRTQYRPVLRHILPFRQNIAPRRSYTGVAALTLLFAAGPAFAQPEQAGSTALAEGTVIATGSDGIQRNLHDGDAVYSGDSISTGSDSYADLELDDGGRILLHPGSAFQIAEYHFDPAAHGLVDTDNSQPNSIAIEEMHESAIFRLIKGGLRAIDGLIGKSHPNDYAMQTPVATIGIRGTEYDVRYCDNNCLDEAENGKAPDNGLYTAVNEGAIGVSDATGVSVIKKGGYGFLAGRHMRLQRLKRLPFVLRHMSLPTRYRARAARMRKLIRMRRVQRWKQHHRRLLQHRRRHRFGT